MPQRFDTYKYQFKVGNRIVAGGVTHDLERQEKELQKEWPGGRIKQVGRITTEEAARKWEKEKGYPGIAIKYPDPQPGPGIGSVTWAAIRRAFRLTAP